MKPNLSIRILIVALASLQVPFLSTPVAASPSDTPATFVCQVTVQARAGLAASLQDVDVDRDGRLLLSGFDGTDTTQEDMVAVADASCNTVWTIRSTTTGLPFNLYQSAAFDGAGRVVAAHVSNDGAGNDNKTVRLLDAEDGSTLFSTENLVDTFGAAYNAEKVDDTRVNGTTANYFVSHNTGVLSRYNDGPLTRDFSQSVSSVTTLRADEATGIVYARRGGATPEYYRLNADTGAILHTSNIGVVGSVSKPPIRSEIANANVYVAAAVSSAMSYHKLLATDFSNVATSVAVTDNQIDVGAGPVSTNVVDFDLDAQDNLLMCGTITGRSWAAKVRTSDDTHRWNVTTTETGLVECGFDYQGGFWIAGLGTSGGTGYFWARRYSGGDFSTPAQPGDILPPEPPEPEPVFGEVDFGSGVANFAADIGFDSEPSLFFFGLILVIIMFLVVAGATKGVSDSEVAAGMGGGIAGMGTMVFNTTQELWPPWATVVLIVLTNAVILFFTRSLFTGSGGGGE
jgi:hypothetical protein